MAATFVQDLGLVAGVAGVTAAIARWLGQPTILGYLAAGFVVGPYLPLPLFADHDRVHALAEFGIILVMFAVGLEFRLGRLLELLPRAGPATLFQVGALGKRSDTRLFSGDRHGVNALLAPHILHQDLIGHQASA